MPGEGQEGKKGQEGSEIVRGKKPYNPTSMKSELEKKMMASSGVEEDEENNEIKGQEGEEEETEGASENEGGEEETDPEEEAKAKEKEAERERKEKRNRELEEALGGGKQDIPDKLEENMTETEKALNRALKEERRKNVLREESDTLVRMLESYSDKERELLDPEIRKFLKTEEYKALSGLTVAKRAAMVIAQARGVLVDKLQEATEKATTEKLKGRSEIEKLSGGPKKKIARETDAESKELAKLRKAASDGDHRALSKLAGKNDPLLDRIIGDR